MDMLDLLTLCEKRAQAKYCGHMIMVRAGKGWKVVFGKPALDIPILQAINDELSLDGALHLAIIQCPEVGETNE